VNRIATAFLVLAAACTPTQWDKPGAADATYNADYQACHWQAKRQEEMERRTFMVPGRPAVGAPLSLEPTLRREELFDRCMTAKGYRRVPLP
jgi:hypothetical protein